jgi:hypothetical protein
MGAAKAQQAHTLSMAMQDGARSSVYLNWMAAAAASCVLCRAERHVLQHYYYDMAAAFTRRGMINQRQPACRVPSAGNSISNIIVMHNHGLEGALTAAGR